MLTARENVELTTLYPLTSGNGCKKVSSAFCLPCISSSRYREIPEASRLSPLSSSRSPISLPYPFLPVSFWQRVNDTQCRPCFFFVQTESLEAKFQESKQRRSNYAFSGFNTFHFRAVAWWKERKTVIPIGSLE